MTMIQGALHKLLKSKLIEDIKQLGEEMSILFQVPAADIIEFWDNKRGKLLQNLHDAINTQVELKEKGVEDSCVNGKIAVCRRELRALDIQLRFIDKEETFTVTEGGLASIFEIHIFPDSPNNPMAGATERQY